MNTATLKVQTGLVSLLLIIFSNFSSFGFTLTLKPGAAAGKDAILASNTPTTNFSNHPEYASTSWTCSGDPCLGRGLLQFDLSTIPPGSYVSSARISLFAAPTPIGIVPGAAMQGDNESVLQRITSSWSENTVTWNTAPTTTTVNQVILPESTSSTQNYLNVDVRNIVQDMVNNPATSFGFLIKQTIEVPFAAMVFASSDNSNSARWPEITIEYYFPTTVQPLVQSTFCPGSPVNVQYNGGGNSYNAGNTFTAQLSNASGSFVSPVNIGTISSTSSGVINAVIPGNTPFGTGYRIRVVSSNPIIVSSDNGTNISIPNPDDNNVCTTDACNTQSGTIVHANINVDDNNVCTSDGCNSVSGVFHNLINPDDNNVCTNDGCNSISGVFNTPVNVDDGSVCTTDGCNSLTGIFHNPVNKDDQNPCTIDICDAIVGVIHLPVNVSDNNLCTIDACNTSNGNIAHVPVNFDDNNLCTTDGCDPQTGVFHNTINPDDGNACTFDICGAQTGVLHFPLAIDDNNLCTQDACNSLTGDITHDVINIDDNNACTEDLCFSTTGIFHLSLNTDDGNACTLDGCNTITGVYHTPYNVDDNNNCTIDQCDTQSGNIYHIDDSPDVTATADPILCYGGTTCITVVASGGTPPYFSEGTFCGYNSGTYSFDITDSKGCEAASSPITVNEPAKLTVVTSTFPSGCLANDGSANALGAGGIQPYNFIWTPGLQSGNSATNLAPGNYLVTLTDDNGCTATASAVVGSTGGNVNAPSSINGPAAVCAKQTGVVYCISNPDPTASSFIWSLPAGVSLTSVSNSSCITVKFTSKFKGGFICAKAVYPCGTSSNTCLNVLLVTKKPLTPGGISGPLSLCPNQTATYSVSPVPDATSYNWSEDHMTILSGQGTNTIIAKADAGFNSGKVKVKAVNCKGLSGERKLYLSLNPVCRLTAGSGISKSETSLDKVLIYPNPTPGKFHIDFNSVLSRKTSVKILDLTGKVVYSEVISIAENVSSREIDPGNLASGLYLVTISDLEQSKTFRVVIE